MVAKRGKDGNVVEEPTVAVGKRRASAGKEPTGPLSGGSKAAAANVHHDTDPTVIMGGHGSAVQEVDTTPVETSDDQETIIYRKSKKSGVAVAEGEEGGLELPVGWLVVVAGPGKGNVRKLVHGVNSLGRSPDERVSLAFGDMAISSEKHALIAYEPESRKFHITHHSGTNLTYLNDKLVMGQAILKPQSQIRIGDTILRFIPLCGDTFSWDDVE